MNLLFQCTMHVGEYNSHLSVINAKACLSGIYQQNVKILLSFQVLHILKSARACLSFFFLLDILLLDIVNLLLCGQAVSNVFDGRMDLGGGMFLKGKSQYVEVGFPHIARIPEFL